MDKLHTLANCHYHPAMKTLDLLGGAIGYEGAVSVEKTANGVLPWRLRHTDCDLIHPDLQGMAKCASGVRLTFSSDTATLCLACSNPATEHALIDLVIDGQLTDTRILNTPGRYDLHFENLPAGAKRIEIYLPNYQPTTIHAVSVDGDADVTTFGDNRPRWIAYGSSITMCRRAHSPTRAWPAMVADALGWHLTSLGFGGQCKFDPIVARTIAAQPADVLNFCLGVNTYEQDYSPRTWSAAVAGCIMTVRDAHPDTPLLIISPTYSPPRETTPGKTGLTHSLMRQWLADLVDIFQVRGDRHIAYVNGLDIFGQADTHLFADQVHPNADGIELMGQRITNIFQSRLPEIGGAHLLPRYSNKN